MKPIIEYVRKKDGNLKGVLIGYKDEVTNNIQTGWSLCSKRDVFNKEKGKLIAMGRAKEKSSAEIPTSIEVQYYKFIRRCQEELNRVKNTPSKPLVSKEDVFNIDQLYNESFVHFGNGLELFNKILTVFMANAKKKVDMADAKKKVDIYTK